MRLEVTVNDTKGVHVEEGAGYISGDAEPYLRRQVHLLLHVKQIVKGAWHVLEGDHNVGNLGYNSH